MLLQLRHDFWMIHGCLIRRCLIRCSIPRSLIYVLRRSATWRPAILRAQEALERCWATVRRGSWRGITVRCTSRCALRIGRGRGLCRATSHSRMILRDRRELLRWWRRWRAWKRRTPLARCAGTIRGARGLDSGRAGFAWRKWRCGSRIGDRFSHGRK